jgi:hypothetical protein
VQGVFAAYGCAHLSVCLRFAGTRRRSDLFTPVAVLALAGCVYAFHGKMTAARILTDTSVCSGDLTH